MRTQTKNFETLELATLFTERGHHNYEVKARSSTTLRFLRNVHSPGGVAIENTDLCRMRNFPNPPLMPLLAKRYSQLAAILCGFFDNGKAIAIGNCCQLSSVCNNNDNNQYMLRDDVI